MPNVESIICVIKINDLITICTKVEFTNYCHVLNLEFVVIDLNKLDFIQNIHTVDLLLNRYY